MLIQYCHADRNVIIVNGDPSFSFTMEIRDIISHPIYGYMILQRHAFILLTKDL